MIKSLSVLVVAALGVVACSSSGTDTASTTSATTTTVAPAAPPSTEAPTTTVATTTTTAAPKPVRYDAPGPFAAGVTTVDLGDRQAEVWYPVAKADAAGKATEVVDTRTLFPENLRAVIPAELVAQIDTGAVRDAPADPGKNRPVVVYSHGFGGYRQVATRLTSHLATWGFIVVSVDHLERGLAAQITNQIQQIPGKDVADVRAALAKLAELNQVGPLVGRVDVTKVVIAGHSAGSGTVIRAGNEIAEIVGLVSISGGINASEKPVLPAKSALVLMGEKDEVITAARSTELFESLTARRTLVNFANAGHNTFTDTCVEIRNRGGLESLRPLIGRLVDLAEDGCTPENADPAVVELATKHYVTAFATGMLTGTDSSASLAKEIAAELGVALAAYDAKP